MTAADVIPFQPCPESGTGVHSWLMGAARACQRAGIPEAEASALITARISRPPSPANEVEVAVAKAYSTEPTAGLSRWPARDWTRIREIAADARARGVTVQAIRDAYAILLRAEGQEAHSPAEVLRALFPNEGALLCCAEHLARPVVKTRAEWEATGLWERLQFLVPNPMLGLSGMTAGPNAHESPRALSNVGPRRWLVIECDFSAEDVTRAGAASSLDLCAAIFAHLSDYGRLTLIVHSGGKSLHCWFAMDRNESELRRLMEYAVSIGADPKTWTANQFVRLPGGLRDSGARQGVLFFNAAVAARFTATDV
jgi:hypothetical protein